MGSTIRIMTLQILSVKKKFCVTSVWIYFLLRSKILIIQYVYWKFANQQPFNSQLFNYFIRCGFEIETEKFKFMIHRCLIKKYCYYFSILPIIVPLHRYQNKRKIKHKEKTAIKGKNIDQNLQLSIKYFLLLAHFSFFYNYSTKTVSILLWIF
jgi:hypothetical protein